MSEKSITPYKKKKVLIDKKVSIIVYAVTLILAVILRSIQLTTNMDFSRGKYIDPSIAKNYPVFIILIGFILIILILIFGESRDKAIKSCVLLNPMRLKSDRSEEHTS